MNTRIHRRFRPLQVLLALALLAAAGAATASAGEKCDPLFLDGAALESARTDIDNACVCSAFDGSEGSDRSAYKKCVAAQVRAAVESSLVRKACKGSLKKMYAATVCGTGDPDLAPCVETSLSGKRRCRIKSQAWCEERSGLVCAGRTTCVDAADTNGDLVVDENDSGLCIPLAPTTTLPPETTTTTSTTEQPETTTTSTTEEPDSTTTTTEEEPTTTTTMPILCGEESPDIVVEVNRELGPEYYELVREDDGPFCYGQTVSGGGCDVRQILDGQDDVVMTFYADNTTDGRMCSQEDAALDYYWEFFYPVTLQAIPYNPSWLVRDSPVMVIPPSTFPGLEDTNAGADVFFRARLTVTPMPVEGEMMTPAPTVLHFRFQYQGGYMSLELADAIKRPDTCDAECREFYRAFCEHFPGRCPWSY